MDNNFNFKKNKRLLICVDSDGCAMDTMDIKHKQCFGPKAVEIWGLQAIEGKFLEIWNEVNLYSETRGINRFKGLVRTFELLEADGIKVPEYASILQWTNSSKQLSNQALEEAIDKIKDKELMKTLNWSCAVNQEIQNLRENNKPFVNVKEGLHQLSSIADIVVVSSANGDAVKAEWTHHGLIQYVNLILGQESGSKKSCIANLKSNNYSEDEVLMVGDALGDLKAAFDNGVLFYPILVSKESSSWKQLAKEAIHRFKAGDYRGEYQKRLIEDFKSILN